MQHAHYKSGQSSWFSFRPSRMNTFASSGVGAPASAGGGGTPAAPPAGPVAPPAAPAPATPPASPTGTQGAPPAPPTGQPPTPATGGPADPNAGNLDILRQAHATIQKLGGDPAKLEAAYNQVNQLHKEGLELAQKLGYTPESFEAGFAADPADVITFLREAANKANPPNAGDPNANAPWKKDLDPVMREIQTLRAREWNQFTERELETGFGNHEIFKGSEMTPQLKTIKDVIINTAKESIKYDQAALKEIAQGQSTKLNHYLNEAIKRVVETINSYNHWVGSKGGRPPAAAAGAPGNGGPPAAPVAGKDFSLQDIIDGNFEKAGKVMPNLR